MIRRFNPSSIPAPSGSYVHGIEVPPGARLVYVAGQTPGRMDGSVPASIEEQVETVWQRIGAILADAGMGYADIIRVTTYVTRPEYMPVTSAVRRRILGENRPTATLLCVTSLADPRYFVEIDCVAAKV